MMIPKMRNTTFKWAVVSLALTLLVGCSSYSSKASSSQNDKGTSASSQQNHNGTPSTVSSSSQASANIIEYKNKQYGFTFKLPKDWKGFSIVTSKWEGLAQGQNGESVVETGPIISIRDPKWTSQTPRQDIPIMVFTLNQWNSLQKGGFHIGAAPIGPSELGRNNRYVFALPARYNFAFPPGYEEVEKILANHPLQTTQITQTTPSDTAESLLSKMMVSAKQGKVINSDFSAKTNTIEDVQKVWGKADHTDWVAAAKGTYATYSNHQAVFGINKGEKIFEVRSYSDQLKEVHLATAKAVLGTPVHDVKVNNQEIIGYAVSSTYKLELVFPQPTNDNPNPVIDHYNVLYPKGTINSMEEDPGRQW